MNQSGLTQHEMAMHQPELILRAFRVQHSPPCSPAERTHSDDSSDTSEHEYLEEIDCADSGHGEPDAHVTQKFQF